MNDNLASQLAELMVKQHETVESAISASLPPPVAAPPQIGQTYSHESMIDLMVRHPEFTHEQFAAAYGRKSNWFASVLASEGFQQALAPRKHEIADPSLTATMDERMRALSLQALNVLQSKLDGKEVTDFTVLKAVEIGTKALGMGAALQIAAPPPVIGAQAVADRIMEAMAMAKQRQQAAVNREAVDVEAKVVPSGS